MGRSSLTPIAIIAVVVVLLVAGYVFSQTSRAPPATTTATVTQPVTVTRPVTVTETVTTTMTQQPKPSGPRLVADILVAERSSLPPYTYVQIDSWRSHEPSTLIVFSPSSDKFVVGVTRFVENKPVSEVQAYSISGDKVSRLWTYSAGSGYIRSLAWSSDGRIVFIGEDSLDGRLVAVDAATGRELWSYETSRDLGKGSPEAQRWDWPTVYGIRYSDGRVYAIASVRPPQLKTGKLSIVYCFDAINGSLLWRFPREGLIDTLTTDLELSPDGRYLAVATWYYKGKEWVGGDLILLDAATGELVGRFRPSPRPPFTWSGSWGGLSWLDNNTIAYAEDRGRLYLLKAPSLEPALQINVTNPLPALVISGSGNTTTTEEGYVYAYSGYGEVVRTPTGHTLVLVRTSNTYGLTAQGVSARPTIIHPDDNSIFIYEWRGGRLEFVAKYPLMGKPNTEQWVGYSPVKGLLAVSVAHNYISRTMVYTGVYLLNVSSIDALASGEALSAVIKPPRDYGVVIGGMISPDGSTVVMVTYPINTGTADKPEFVGDYRILVYKLG